MARGGRMPSVDALGQAWLDADHGLPSWMTFTRGAGSWSRQTAPAVDGTTFIELGTAQNTPRFDYDPTSGRTMLLIEPTRRNDCLWSNWADAGEDDVPDNWTTGGGVAATDFTTQTAGPHGGRWLQLEDTAVADRGCSLNTGSNWAIATEYAQSVWVRRTGAGAATLYGMLGGGAPNPSTLTLQAVAHDWALLQAQYTTGGGPSSFQYMLRAATDPAGLVGLCLPQIEIGDCASSHIPTGAAAVTRAAELCAIDPSVVGRTSGYISFLWRPDFASTASLTADPVLFAWAPNWELVFDPADDKLKVVVNGTKRASSSALTFARQSLHRVTVRYGTAGQQLTVDTAAPVTDATAWGDPGALAPYLGSRAASVNCRPAAYGDFLSAAA